MVLQQPTQCAIWRYKKAMKDVLPEWLEKVSEDDYKLPDITAEKVFSSLF
jgi:hypothetical protein